MIEFSQAVDALTQKVLSSDIDAFIEDSKTFWASYANNFMELLHTIVQNPLREVQLKIQESAAIAPAAGEKKERWDY